MVSFLPRNTSASYRRPGLDPVRKEKGLHWNTRIDFGVAARILPVVAVVVLAATALGCASEPEAVGNSPIIPSSGAGSSSAERSEGTSATIPVPTTAPVGAGAPTETVNTDSAGQANNTPIQPGQSAEPTDTPRPATPTPSPDPEPTATAAVHTQSGGSVIMQAPTLTPFPTPTQVPVSAPHWSDSLGLNMTSSCHLKEPFSGLLSLCAIRHWN